MNFVKIFAVQNYSSFFVPDKLMLTKGIF